MEVLTTVISLLILGLLIVSPIMILRVIRKRNVKYVFITYFFSGLLITSLIIVLFAWWSDFSIKILLNSYGYDFNGMDFSESCKNVAAENLMRVKELNKRLAGIGWPLKAIMVYVFYLPYLLIVYVMSYLFKKPTNNILFSNH